MFEDILINGIFIIRGGFFGFDWTHKLFYLLGGIALCIYDWKKNKRKDYFWVYLFGALLYIGVWRKQKWDTFGTEVNGYIGACSCSLGKVKYHRKQ